MATTAAVRTLLGATSLPAELVEELLAGVSAVWLMGEPAAALAGDLVLCHPRLGSDEVRAVVRPTASASTWRLTVVAHDRPGLLAGMAGALADRGLSITGASATVLPGPGVALQRVTAVAATGPAMKKADWDGVGLRLQAALGRREPTHPLFRPVPPVAVECQPQGLGRVMVTVTAPDRVGLLWAVAAWFEDHGCNVETCRASSERGVATDTFVVVGDCDGAELAAAVGGVPVAPWSLPSPVRAGLRAGRTATAAAAAGSWTAALRLLRPPRRDGRPPT